MKDDLSEVRSFEWDSHWEQYGDPTTGNPANRYRERLIFQLLGHPGKGDVIIDIGSGQGELALQLANSLPEARVWGVEASEEGVKRAQESARKSNSSARFLVRDLLEDVEVSAEHRQKGTYALCTEVLEHVDNPDQLVRHALDYLAPGCHVVVTVPGGPRSAFDRQIGHRRHFSRKQLADVLVAGGLRVEHIYAAGFPFFNLYKLAVIARGEGLVKELDAAVDRGSPSGAARAALAFFEKSFALNLRSTPFGWQMVALATVPAAAGLPSD